MRSKWRSKWRIKKKAQRKAKKNPKKAKKQQNKSQKVAKEQAPELDVALAQLDVDDDSEDDGQCARCGKIFSQELNEGQVWIYCDRCEQRFCFECHKLSKDNVPKEFFCIKCT